MAFSTNFFMTNQYNKTFNIHNECVKAHNNDENVISSEITSEETIMLYDFSKKYNILIAMFIRGFGKNQTYKAIAIYPKPIVKNYYHKIYTIMTEYSYIYATTNDNNWNSTGFVEYIIDNNTDEIKSVKELFGKEILIFNGNNLLGTKDGSDRNGWCISNSENILEKIKNAFNKK